MLLQKRGYDPEYTRDFGRSMRLASSARHHGSVFIINWGSHYTAFVLRHGTW